MIPSPHTVQVKRWVESTVPDPRGNTPGSFAAPVPWRVRSIDPVSNREPGAEHRDLSTIAHVIHADKTGQVPGYRDLVVIGNDEFAVDGYPDDWTNGPWPNPAAGVTVWLKRVEG